MLTVEFDLEGEFRRVFTTQYLVSLSCAADCARLLPKVDFLVAKTNLRDALSHLGIILDPTATPQTRISNLACAEEHLRRAGMESYQAVLERFLGKIIREYQAYRSKYLQWERVRNIKIDHAKVKKGIDEIKEELINCRMGKSSPGWAKEIGGLAGTCSKASALLAEVKSFSSRHRNAAK